MQNYLVILHDAQDSSPAGREELKLRLIENLHISRKSVDSIFNALPVIIRQNIEQLVAERYAETLENLGAVAEVIEQTAAVEQTINPAPAAPAEAPKQEVAAADDSIEDLEQMLEQALSASEAEAAAESEADWDLPSALKLGEDPEVASTPPPLFDFADEAKDSAPRPSLLDDLIAFESNDASEQVPHEQAAVTHAEPESKIEPALPLHASAFSGAFRAPAESEQQIPEAAEIGAVSAKQTPWTGLLLGFSLLLILGFAKAPLLSVLGLQSHQRMEITFNVEGLLREQGWILGQQGSDKDSHMPEVTGVWTGTTESNGITVTLRITELDHQLSRASLELSAAEPKRLTEKEFAEGKASPIWLRRGEAVSVLPLVGPDPAQEQSVNTSVMRGLGKLYLSDSHSSDRISVLTRVITGPRTASDQSLKMRWVVSRTGDTTNPPKENVLRRTNGSDFEIYLSGEIELSKDSAPAAAIAASEPAAAEAAK